MKTFFTFIALSTFILAQNPISELQFESWNNFNQQYNNKWKIKWNTFTGSPASIFGAKTKSYIGDQISSSKTFLGEISNLFLINKNLSDLELSSEKNFNDIKQVSYIQKFNGISVYNSDISITFNNENQVIFINANYYVNLKLVNEEHLDMNQAIITATNAIKLADLVKTEAEIMILPLEDNALLVWKVFLRNNLGEMYQVIVDAETGEILDKQKLNMGAIGKLNYYPVDPINSSLLTNQNAQRLDATGYLSGVYVNVLTDITNRAYESNFMFTYNVNDDHFKEGNIYWHLDNIAYNYYYLGLQHDMNIINAIVRNGTGGSYDFYNDQINCGASTDTLDNYEENRSRSRVFCFKNDQIYHEYSHAVVMRIGLNYNTTEVQARNEGYADYFACSFTNDPIYGEWIAYDAPHLRIVSNNSAAFSYKNWNNISYYNDYNSSKYTNGMIWSGACWDLRTTLGQSVADKIIFRGLIQVHGSYDFETAMDGIISADYDLFGGSHVSTIETIFNNRSILNPSAPTGLSITGSYGEHPTVNWTQSREPDVNGYEVYRSFQGGAYILVKTINKIYVTGYTDPNSTIGSPGDPTTCYKIKATDKYGNKSAMSSSICIYDGGINKKNLNSNELVENYNLYDGFPNPFNPSSTIRIAIPEESKVLLEIYNSLGMKIATLENNVIEVGQYEYIFDANNLSSGIYYSRLTAQSLKNNKFYYKTNKLIFIK